MPLQKGITEVKYKNKDNSITTKYRVRINKKEFRINKLLDTLELANELINTSKTNIGRNNISKFLLQEEEKKIINYNDYNNSLRNLISIYNRQHYQKVENNYVDLKNNKSYDSHIKTIINTRIQDWRAWQGLSVLEQEIYKDMSTIIFGDLNVFEITQTDVNFYIIQRLKTYSKSTVKRELNILASFFNNFHTYSSPIYKRLSDENPTKNVGKKLLANSYIKKDRRLTKNEEERLMDVLLNKKNKEVFFIVAISLATAMRRSEIMLLTKECIHQNYIELRRTKNGMPRKVNLITLEAKKIFEAVLVSVQHKKPDERVFNLSIEGFKTAWQRARSEAGIKTLTFHDLRSEFISRALEFGLNEILVSEIASIKSQKYFDNTHLIQHEQNKLNNITKDTQRNAGHISKEMTKHYFRLNKIVDKD